MKTMARLGLSAAAAALALGMVTLSAAAQQPATKPAATTPPTTKAPSPCKGLDKTACTTKGECKWVQPKKPGKDGKVRAPYCRLQPPKKPATTDPKKK